MLPCLGKSECTLEVFEEVQVMLRVGWLCFMSLRQRVHLETAPPFTVPCEGREAR